MTFDPMNVPDLRTGIYRHYKGPLYQVLGYSHNASDDNKPQILYIGLQLDRAHTGPRFATRDVEGEDGFFDLLCKKHGLPFEECDHQMQDNLIKRFAYLGPVYYAGMETV